MVFALSVLNRVYNFALVCPNYKQGIACPKQGYKIELVVLNRVCILELFVLNSVRVSNPQRLTYTEIWVEYPPGLQPITNHSKSVLLLVVSVRFSLVSIVRFSMCQAIVVV